MEYLRNIANVMKISGCDVPDWMLKIKKAKLKEKNVIKRSHITTRTKKDLMISSKKRELKNKIQSNKRKYSDSDNNKESKKIKK